MDGEFERAQKLSAEKKYDEAIVILLSLAPLEENENIIKGDKLRLEILKSLSENYKNLGNLKSAFEYYNKYAEEEHESILLENKEKTDKLNSALKIHQSQKENNLLQEKNNELQQANTSLNKLRGEKNEMLEIVSEELKLPIVTIEGISFNYFRALKDEKQINPGEIKTDLELIENLSQQILEKVNSILQKNKEEQQK